MADANKSTTKPSYAKDLLLLFAVPAGIALIAWLAIYIPRWSAHPKYDFVYLTCYSYNCEHIYSVGGDGKLVQNDKTPSDYLDRPSLHYYSQASNSTRPVSLQEVQRYRLNNSSRSPDGYSLQQNRDGGGGFLFWDDGYDDNWYLKNGGKAKKLDLGQGSYNYNNITLIGWVTQ